MALQTLSAGSYRLSGFLYESSSAAITAGTTRTQAGATQLSTEVNNITTSTAPSSGTVLGDGVALPQSYAGLDVTIINNTANPVQVYPAVIDGSSATINGVGSTVGVAIPPYCVEQFECPVAGTWVYDAGVGFSGPLNTVLSVDNVSAAGSSQGTATVLPADFNRLTTVAAGTGVVLPAAKAGMDIFLLNHGANQVQVYANGTDTIDDIAGSTGVSQMVKSVVLYTCYTTGAWYTNGLATGYANNGLQTLQFADALTAAGSSQGTSLQLTASINRLTTVTAGTGVNLPSSTAGLAVTVINNGANAVQVYPFQGAGDTINGNAATVGVNQMVNSVVTYYCTVAGTWVGVGLGSGYAMSLMTSSFADGLTAYSSGGQPSATPITTTLARFTTVGAANASARLPASTAGLNITVINAGVNNLTVYPNTSEYINSVQNMAYSVPPGGVINFYSTLATYWHSLSSPVLISSNISGSVYGTNTSTSGTTLTAANVGGNATFGASDVILNMTGTLGAAANAQLPTVASLAALYPNLVANQTIRLRVINSSSANYAWTITNNSWTSLTGTMSIAQNTWRDFIITFTSTSAATLQSIGTGTNS